MGKKIVEVNEGVIATNTEVVIPANRHWTVHDGIVIESGATLNLTQPGARLVIVKHPPPINVVTTAVALVLDGSIDVVLADATGGAFPVTLPPLIGPIAKVFTVIKKDNIANVTLTAAAGDTINGAPTQIMTTQYQAITVIPHPTEWSIQ